MSEKYELIDAEKATVTETGEKKYTIIQMCTLAGGIDVGILRMA